MADENPQYCEDRPKACDGAQVLTNASMGSHSLWAHVRARLALARRGAAAALVLHGSRVGAEWELSGSGEQQREAPTRFRRQAGCCALRERPAFGPRLDPKRGRSDGCGHGTELSHRHGRPGRSRPRPARAWRRGGQAMRVIRALSLILTISVFIRACSHLSALDMGDSKALVS